VHGHTHHPGSEPLAPGMLRHVLSDWELDHPPHRAEVLRLSARGFRRITPPCVALP
jgi:UDP-2,3-diacylglucosamine hydrolase